MKKQVLIQGKTIDVDRLKELYAKWFELNSGKADRLLRKNGLEKLKPANGRSFDFKNPDDVFTLHKIIDALGWKKDLYTDFFAANRSLQNVIFDITGKSIGSLETYASMCDDLGYKVSLVWVVTNRMWAMFRNSTRDRVVPQHVFHDIHNQLKNSVFQFLDLKQAAKYVDEAWVIFSGGAGTKLKPENKVDTVVDLEGTVHKIEKQGNSFVIPDKLKKQILTHLGPNEPNPAEPSRYDDYETMMKKMEPYKGKDGKYSGYDQGVDILKQNQGKFKWS